MAELAFDEDDDPATKLQKLGGLKIQHFHDAIAAGEADRRTTTLDDPLSAGGTRDYFLRIRTLRQALRADLGWKRYDFNQVPLVVNPEGTLAIGVSQGTAQTGQPDGKSPKTKYSWGDAKQDLVTWNQGTLFEVAADPDVAQLTEKEASSLETWFLLTRRVRRNGKVVVHSELSRAIGLDKQGHADKWDPRICLPPLEFEGVIDYIEGTDDGPSEYEVDITEF